MFIVYLLLTTAQATAQYPQTDLSHLEMFPKRNDVWQWQRQAERHWEFCKQQRELRMSPWVDWHSIEAAAGRDVMAWNLLQESYGWNDVGYLGELRLLLGEDAYWSGRMPVPQTWHEGWIP